MDGSSYHAASLCAAGSRCDVYSSCIIRSLKQRNVRGYPWQIPAHVHSVQVVFFIGVIAVKPFYVSGLVRRLRVTDVLDMVNRAGGDPLRVFRRSSTTFFTSAVLSNSTRTCP